MNMTDDQYFAHPALDQSQLKEFDKNPLTWAYNRLNPTPTSSPALQFGTAFHAYLLHTDTVAVNPFNARTKDGKKWVEEHNNDIVVNADNYALIERMAHNLTENDIHVLDESVCEQAYFATDPITNLDIKIKPDVLPADTNVIIDIKTSINNTPDHFARSIVDYGYARQAVFYADVLNLVQERDAHTFQWWVFNKNGAGDYMKYSMPLHGDDIDAQIMSSARMMNTNTLVRIRELMNYYFVDTVDDLARALLDDKSDKTILTPQFTPWQLNQLIPDTYTNVNLNASLPDFEVTSGF